MWTGILHFVYTQKAIQNRKLKCDPSEYSFQPCKRIREKREEKKQKREESVEKTERKREKDAFEAEIQRAREEQGHINTVVTIINEFKYEFK